MNRPFSLVAATCLLLMWSIPSAADGNPAAPKEPIRWTTERLVVFKDGYGLVIKRGTASADDAGRAFTTEVPDNVVLGCFWAAADEQAAQVGPGGRILAMRAEWDEARQTRQRQAPCLTVADVLRANLGKVVTLELTDKTDKGACFTEEGRLVELLEAPAEPLVVGPAARAASDATAWALEVAAASGTGAPSFAALVRDGTVTYGTFAPEAIQVGGGALVRELMPRGGELLVLDRGAGSRLVLPVAHVRSVLGADLVTRTIRQDEVYARTKRLSFDFGKEAAGRPVALHLFYFTAGLRWIPTYRVSGDLKDKAEIALQGEILNDVTDIDRGALDLVVGVPNFRFKDNPSPLTLERTMRTALANVDASNRRASNGYFNNAQVVQAQFDNNDVRVVGARGGGGEDMAMAPELAGAGGEQDLFVYSANDFSLKKGARATMPLWQQSAALRHLYTYDIRARRSRASGGFTRDPAEAARSPLQIQMNQVWHQLELTNAGKVPWTTGAALMVRGLLPLGQDLLTYTPPGGKALLPVTVAVDLRGTFDEQEADRRPGALHFDGVDFVLVQKKGTVTVTSYRKEKSDMRVTLATGGKVTGASDDGRIKLNDFRADDWEDNNHLLRVNNHSDVIWELTLDPGQTKTLTYEVSFYLR